MLEDAFNQEEALVGALSVIRKTDGSFYSTMKDLNNLVWSGLFVNDLSMHDYSRDIMLATTQEKIQMKMLLSAAEAKAANMEKQQKKLGEVMKKSEDLISQMLPKSVADELAKGKTNEEICKSYDLVTMLFSDIVTFTVICSKLKPLQVDSLIITSWKDY